MDTLPTLVTLPAITVRRANSSNSIWPKILDKDFGKGRPMYNYTLNRGLITPNNLAIKPSYNVGLTNNHLVYDFLKTINTNLALRTNLNLNRLERGGS